MYYFGLFTNVDLVYNYCVLFHITQVNSIKICVSYKKKLLISLNKMSLYFIFNIIQLTFTHFNYHWSRFQYLISNNHWNEITLGATISYRLIVLRYLGKIHFFSEKHLFTQLLRKYNFINNKWYYYCHSLPTWYIIII